MFRIVHGQLESDNLTAEQEAVNELAWSGYTLTFKGEPLEEAVAQVNRFSPQRLVIDDARIGELPVHGRIRFSYPDVASQFVLELERQHQVRRTRATARTESTIRLVAFNADPARFGSGQAQLNDDICASYRRQHEPSTLIYDPRDAKRTARFDLASCDLQTALMAFQEQSGFEYSIATAPLPPPVTRPLKGRYSAKAALAMMLAGTGCQATGEVVEGLKIACTRSSIEPAPKRVGNLPVAELSRMVSASMEIPHSADH